MSKLKGENIKKRKEKKIIFSEKVDDAINGYSLGISFVLISLFFFWQDTYLLNIGVTQATDTIIGIIGLCALAVQLNKSASIKGFDDFGIGLTFVLLWLVCYVKLNLFWLNFLLIFPLILGVYGTIRGIIEIAYSFFIRTVANKDDKSKTTRIKEVFLLITQIFGLILTVLNILKMFGLIGNPA